MRYALPDQAGDLFVKIVEFGPDQWLRVQYLVRPESIRSLKPSGNAPKPGTVQNEGWVNFAMVGAVGLPDDTEVTATAVSETSKADALPFPKVGTVYHFGSGRVATPYFAKVIETLPNGWFRVQTLPFREQPVPPGPREWWIDRSQLGAMQEARPADVPK